MRIASRPMLAFLLLALAPAARAQVWVVDSAGGPGSDFTDIQPAIDASGPGATIIVEPGTYSGFVLGVGLAIVGRSANQTDTLVTGQVTIGSVAGPHRVVLSGLRVQNHTLVQDCSSLVLLDNMAFSHGEPAVRVAGCADVRMPAVNVWRGGIHVADSRLEVLGSLVRGEGGADTDCNGSAGDRGGPGLVATGSSNVLVHATSIQGGHGGHAPDFCEWWAVDGGDGGDAVRLRDSSKLVVAGDSNHSIQGGFGGNGSFWPNAGQYGSPGAGIVALDNSMARHSGVTTWTTFGNIEVAQPPDPFLTHTGTHQGGRLLTFTVHGPAGADALLHLGRFALTIPEPGSPVDQLTSRQRTFLLGPIPASGQLQFSFFIPQGMPIGFPFFAQAEVVMGPGDQRLTGSIPIVMRHLP